MLFANLLVTCQRRAAPCGKNDHNNNDKRLFIYKLYCKSPMTNNNPLKICTDLSPS